jgi:uncharacterized membrane protein
MAHRRSPQLHTTAHQLVSWGFQHWLLLTNGTVLLYGGLPWLSAILRAAGFQTLGLLLWLVYAPLCHQRADQSFALAGYQLAFCQRETVLFSCLFLGGLVFWRVRHQVRPAPLWLGLALLLPLVLDGSSHLLDDLLGLGVRPGNQVGSLNYWLRVVTGALAAGGVLLAVYPRLDRDVRRAQLDG